MSAERHADAIHRAIGPGYLVDRTAILAAVTAAMDEARAEERAKVPGVWRNGVTNTTLIIDEARRKFGSLVRLTAAQRRGVEAFDGFLDKMTGDWFNASRAAAPQTYEEAEAVFKAHIATLPTERKD